MEVNPKDKSGFVKLLGSIVLGLVFLCMCFVGLGIGINKKAKAEGEELASIYVDSGATTNITGGTIGAMESGNSVYVADGGTLNVTGGTVSGNIYSGGTLNYTAGTLNSVTLASGKYITFKGNPSSTISITLDSPSVGTNIGYLDGISSVTLTRLSVTNLPSNTELRISGNYITIAYVNRTVSFAVDPSGYGTVSQSTLSVPHGSSVSVSGSTLSYGGTSITATPTNQTAQYTYSFAGWYVGDTQITSSRAITANTTITARFTRTTRTYTVTITRNYTSYGNVSTSSVTNVPYGTVLSTSSNTLNVNGTTVTATPATASAQYTYAFSSWTNGTATVTGNTTVTANFTRSTRTYTVTIHEYNGSYGTVSPTTINVPYGTRIYRGSSITQLYVGETLVTATPNSSTAQYSYSVSSWREDSSSGKEITTTGFTLEGDKTIYVRFTRLKQLHTVYAYARYSTSSSGTNSGATAGITGGTATITYGSVPSTTTGTGAAIKYVTYGDSVTLTAEAKTGYVFVGWYSSTGSNSAVSTSSSYSLTVTETTYRYAFFRSSTYVVTITVNNSNYGSVSKNSITVAGGTTITTDYDTITFSGSYGSVTATAKEANASGYYQFSSWNIPSKTVNSNMTITASFTRYDSSLVVFESDQANLRTGKYDILNLSHESIYVRDGDTYIIDGNKIEIGDIQVVASGRNDYMMTSQFYRWRNTSTPSVTSGTITGNNNVFHAYSGDWQLTPIKVSLTVGNNINSDAYSIVTEMEDGSTTTVANKQTVEWDVFFGSTIRFGESYVQDTPTMLLGFWVYDWGPVNGAFPENNARYVSSIDTLDSNFGVRVFINGVFVDPTDIANIELPLEGDVKVVIEII